MFQNRFSLYLATLACAAVAAPLAFAGGAPQTPAKSALPGVGGDYSIVRPLPAEPDGQDRNASPNQFKIGDMDVRIGGSITVDIGAGSLSSPRH
ncbi:hypothetical protein [Mesorhizobium sp. A623]